MVWILLIYTMGFFITNKMMENSFDMNDDPWAGLMWPLLLIALFVQWLEGK